MASWPLLVFYALITEAVVLATLTFAPEDLRYPVIRLLKQAFASRPGFAIAAVLAAASTAVFCHESWLLHAGKQFGTRCETADHLPLADQLEGQKCMLQIRTHERNWYLQGAQALLLFLVWGHVRDAKRAPRSPSPPSPPADRAAAARRRPTPPSDAGNEELGDLISSIGMGSAAKSLVAKSPLSAASDDDYYRKLQEQQLQAHLSSSVARKSKQQEEQGPKVQQEQLQAQLPSSAAMQVEQLQAHLSASVARKSAKPPPPDADDDCSWDGLESMLSQPAE